MEMAPCRRIGVELSMYHRQGKTNKQTLMENKKFQDLSSGYFTNKEKHQ